MDLAVLNKSVAVFFYVFTIRYEAEGSSEPSFRDVVPVGEEHKAERPVEGDPRPRGNLPAEATSERRLDQGGHIVAFNLGEQVKVFVIASEDKVKENEEITFYVNPYEAAIYVQWQQSCLVSLP